MEIAGIRTAVIVCMYYVGWVFLFVLVPDVRSLGEPEEHSHHPQLTDDTPPPKMND